MKLLPKSYSDTTKGFTLIELMVVIAIIAILSVIGVTVFTTVQGNARDSKRRADIDAVANALEVNKSPTGTYNILAIGNFAGNAIIANDGSGNSYCAIDSQTSTATIANPAAPLGLWLAACPTNYTIVSATNPAAATLGWKVCTSLERTPFIYCKGHAQ